MHDIIFCSLPYSNLDHLYSAPAVLKGVVTANNYQAKTVDFGLTLLDLCDRDLNLFNRVQTYFISPRNLTSHREEKILDLFYKEILDFFKKNPARYIGISIFSVYTHKSAAEVISMLRDHKIDAKIIVGGRGAKAPLYSNINLNIAVTTLDKTIEYGNLLKKKKLIDHVVFGDGEDAIIEILRGNSIPEDTNNRTETFTYPLPNYDDYNFDSYLTDHNNNIPFPITGSKGCIRDCDFCDIKYQMGKYRYRNGSHIANEMLYIAEKYGFRKFQFTDSLVNGGLKTLEEFCMIIADHNLKNPNKKIIWSGSYICRPETEMPKRLYKLMAESGAEGLTIGAESGSNHVLKIMNKRTTVEALYSELEQFRQHGITCVLLTFVGHWSETFDDFIDTCKMLVRILPYVRSGTISGVSLGVLAKLDGSSEDIIEKYHIRLDKELGKSMWVSELNPTNTLKERIYRRLIISRLAKELKIPCVQEYTNLLDLSLFIELSYNQINKFHNDYV